MSFLSGRVFRSLHGAQSRLMNRVFISGSRRLLQNVLNAVLDFPVDFMNSQLRNKAVESSHLFGNRRKVNSPNKRLALLSEEFRDCFVGGDHELFNQTVTFRRNFFLDAGNLAFGVVQNFSFRQIEVQAALFVTAAAKRQRQRTQVAQQRLGLTGDVRVTCIEILIHLFVGQAFRRANHRIFNLDVGANAV